ncbi:ABC transporter permease [Lentilactobacillus sp. IMAU92037]|uniref:ABC transporter permease n=1 Tax=Lentilactobacillus dabitei TaxID=2831523 RepID=UPI001C25DCF8|nr:ABC transporter permease [Lentilactobacillus dabitei]MBU9789257.1 ABC transporter permease [Lentilactobacillus dabitei]MBV0931552.1 ABC transporter permease [Lentilactobacillus dabitei]
MLSLCKRNLLLYFRDKSGVFFSILGAMISLVLYVIFIKKSMLAEWSQVPGAKQLLDLWLIGGTLAITAVTATLASWGQFVKDEEHSVLKDFYLTDISPFQLKMSYMHSAGIIGFMMQLIMLAMMLAYFNVTDNLAIPWSKLLAIILVALLSSYLAVILNMLITQFVHKVDTFSRLNSIIGTAAGFLIGTYIPIGALPNFAQILIKLTPPAYVAAIYRQILMGDKIKAAFKTPDYEAHFNKLMGVKLSWSHLLSLTATSEILFIVFWGSILVIFMTELVKKKQSAIDIIK